MLCFEVEVETTNTTNDKFKTGGKYHDCLYGTVYVVAKNVHDAAAQIPEAKLIKLLGPAFPNGEQGGAA